MRDAIIVGGGIIGSTLAKVLRKRKLGDVLLLDCSKEFGGTTPSGSHLNPSWFGKVPKTKCDGALQMLDEAWGLMSVPFTSVDEKKGNGRTTVHRVDTDVVMREKRVRGEVIALDHLKNHPQVTYLLDGEKVVERCRLLLVAAGAWTPHLLHYVKLVVKQGVSFRLRGKCEPFLKPWRPYHQIVSHQQGENELWVGDGTAVIPANWKQQRTDDCFKRCREAVMFMKGSVARTPEKTLVGWRPYAEHPEEQPCHFERLGPRAWVATGSGKSGTLSAGYVTKEITDAAS